jgi:CBS domain-containing protein
MKARDVMTENPDVVSEGESVRNAARKMRDLNVGLIPVVDDATTRRLRGVITDRDLAVRHVAEGHSEECTVGDEMSRDGLVTVTPDDSLDTVMSRMREGQVRRVPVVENGAIVGIIAQADLAVDTGSSHALEVERTIEKISEPAEPER